MLLVAASGPLTDPEDCLVRAAEAPAGESKAARVKTGRAWSSQARTAACGFAPRGASRSTGDASLITFSLEASLTKACLIADSAADSDS